MFHFRQYLVALCEFGKEIISWREVSHVLFAIFVGRTYGHLRKEVSPSVLHSKSKKNQEIRKSQPTSLRGSIHTCKVPVEESGYLHSFRSGAVVPI